MTYLDSIRRGLTTAKLIKMGILALLLAGAGCFFGLVLRWVGDGWEHLVPPTWDALYLGLWLLGALAVVAVAGGLAAVLLRPFWAAGIAFAISALAVFFTWEISLLSFAVSAIYLLVGLLFVAGVRSEVGNRIKFSVWHLMRSQVVLLMVLTALACTSLYFGYAEEIDRSGFALPEQTIDWAVDMADEHIVDNIVTEGTLTPAQRQEVLDGFREFMEGGSDSAIEPYEGYIPVALAAVVFSIVSTATLLICWLPISVLALIFLILIRTGVVRKTAQAVEVTRLTIE